MEKDRLPVRSASQALEGGILYFIALGRSELSGPGNISKAIRMIHG